LKKDDDEKENAEDEQEVAVFEEVGKLKKNNLGIGS